jgi:integrase
MLEGKRWRPPKMRCLMASLYLKREYWYIKSGGKCAATGIPKGFSKSQVKAKIRLMPDGDKLKSLLFDIKLNNHKNEKVTIDYAVSEYLKTKNGLGPDEKVIDENQARNFRRTLKSAFERILKEFKGRHLDEISDSDVLQWMQKLRGEGLKPSSVRKYVHYLSPIFTFGKSKYRGWCRDNPVLDEGAVRKEMKTNKGVWNYQGREVDISDKEANAFLEAAEKNSRLFYLLMLLNFNVGARRRELLTLKKKDVELKASRFTVLTVNAKVKEQRSVFYGFAPEIGKIMNEICLGKSADDYIFSTDGKLHCSDTWVQKNFNKVKKVAKLPEQWTFRDFRHVAGQRMNANGVPLTVIAEVLGTSVMLLEKTYLKPSRNVIEATMLKKLASFKLAA